MRQDILKFWCKKTDIVADDKLDGLDVLDHNLERNVFAVESFNEAGVGESISGGQNTSASRQPDKNKQLFKLSV